MAEVLTVPVSTVEAAADSALATHETLDAAAHEQIAQTEDEDYKWLTDRLDAHQRQISELQSLVASQREQILSAFQTGFEQSQSQSRTLIESLTTMVNNLTTNLTALSESALLRSTPQNSESSSQNDATETATETVTESVPAESAVTQESGAARSGVKKRLRI